MADWRKGYTEAAPPPSSIPSRSSDSGASGVCIMSSSWRDEQHPSFISFISSFLNANAFRLNFVPIAPVATILRSSSRTACIKTLLFHLVFPYIFQDFIFNCGGVSVAFIFLTNWDGTNMDSIFDRVKKLKGQFAHFYVVVTLPTKEQNDSFVHSYFRYGMEIGRPTFMPVQDVEMGFEKIVNISHARGVTFAVCKRQNAIAKLKAERERSVQGMDIFLKVVSSIPGVDKHDANALIHAIGSIEAISKASKEYILENTDLSAEKAEKITSFFRDPKFYLSPKLS